LEVGNVGRLGLQPACRCQRARPGELLHIDIKKLGRIHGGAREPRRRLRWRVTVGDARLP
jgi:hypothetical protein